MNILLISQCDKRALTESRRILDQFAERRGDRTWQTPITEAGLDTLRRLLRKTARKNTAVACHWIRGRDHTELLWIVGDASRFNAEGAVPTNTTKRNVLRKQDENDWHSLQDIYLLSSLAALLHDLGKATVAFQRRLISKHDAPLERNQYRHEWVSLRLFQAFVGESSDEQWLQRLIAPTAEDDASWLKRLQKDGLDPVVDKPLASLPPLAQAVGWLVVTHHRLPAMPYEQAKNFRSSQLESLLGQIGSDWNEPPTTDDRTRIEPYWQFDHGLPVTTSQWRKRAAKLAKRLLDLHQRPNRSQSLESPYLMHLSRLGLMLADHHYSSLTAPEDRVQGERNSLLYANTNRKTGGLNQPLDEHLLGVEVHAAQITRALPGFERELPRLARHKGLRKRAQTDRFRWQDRATDAATAIRDRAAQQGAFLVNMASTGCGKTLANARIMNALADPAHGMRCAFAMGLRTLTLQTGRAFQQLLSLSDEELAIRVGGAANRELFEHFARQAERSGSESTQSLLPDDAQQGDGADKGVLFEGNIEQPLLKRAMKNPDICRLLAAPILVCTVDHLVPATESSRGGHQIAPMLRLMSSDLVLDELDDFDLADLPALTRLVYWAGLLGARVLLSSATLPPALVQGMFEAYRAGRREFQMHRGERPGQPANICCGWFDEFNVHTEDCAEVDRFAAAHQQFAAPRYTRLGQEKVRRRAELVPLSFKATSEAERHTEFAAKALDQAAKLHAQHHSIDPSSGKRVSFGLVRMANIEPLYNVALAMFAHGAPADLRVHLCVYHSQFPLLLRSAIEQRLDVALNRQQPDDVFSLPGIRFHLDQSAEADQLFIVLGSPVCEVGRDHDYDWAVVEPSSMRSLIQLAGRVRRHRIEECQSPNVAIFNCNLRHFKDPGKAAYCKPGFEQDEGAFHLTEHRLDALLREAEWQVIDSRPRIQPRPQPELRPQQRLVDLEHARMQDQMLPKARPTAADQRNPRKAVQPPKINAASFWQLPHAHLTAVLSQQQPFRDDPVPDVELVLLPNEDEDDFELHRIQDDRDSTQVKVENLNHRLADDSVQGERIGLWGEASYPDALERLAKDQDLPLRRCAERYGTVTVPKSEQGWRFHPGLGFAKAK